MKFLYKAFAVIAFALLYIVMLLEIGMFCDIIDAVLMAFICSAIYFASLAYLVCVQEDRKQRGEFDHSNK